MNHLKENFEIIKRIQIDIQDLRAKDVKAREQFEQEFNSLEAVIKIKESQDYWRFRREVNDELNLLLRSMVQSTQRIKVGLENTIAGYNFLYLSRDRGLKIPWKIGAMNLFSDDYSWTGWYVGKTGSYKAQKDGSLEAFHKNNEKDVRINSINFGDLKDLSLLINQKKLRLFLEYAKKVARLWNCFLDCNQKEENSETFEVVNKLRSWGDIDDLEKAKNQFEDESQGSKVNLLLKEKDNIKASFQKIGEELNEINKPFRIVLEMQKSNKELES